MLHIKWISPIGARFQQYYFHCTAIFCIADMRVPILRYFTGNGFIRQADHENIVFIKICCVHSYLLQNRKMVHDCFYYNTIFKHQYCTE
jgi:hypothetical protein